MTSCQKCFQKTAPFSKFCSSCLEKMALSAPEDQNETEDIAIITKQRDDLRSEVYQLQEEVSSLKKSLGRCEMSRA